MLIGVIMKRIYILTCLVVLLSVGISLFVYGCTSSSKSDEAQVYQRDVTYGTVSPNTEVLVRPMVLNSANAAVKMRGSVEGYIPNVIVLPPQNITINTEKYKNYGENPITSPILMPISTFSIDVDSGSYSNARRFLSKWGSMPNPDGVRVEEFINYFDYNYPAPDKKSSTPFSLYVDSAKLPICQKEGEPQKHLLRIAIQGKKVSPKDRPNVNLVFLVDVSGSMAGEDRIELLKKSLLLMLKELGANDKISIVTYAGNSSVLLESVSGSEKGKIKAAINSLVASGYTHGSQALTMAYDLAAKNFIKGGINRIMLCSDGDFNVGIVDHKELLDMIETKRKEGTSLTVLGYGMGNYNDKTMEQMANKGNGNYFYIDTIFEAQKVLVDELSATLETIASDVKVQVDFNPAVVRSYRLIGYENRALKNEEFDDDKVDAGEIGAGHNVTALYEITLLQDADALPLGDSKSVFGNVDLDNFKFESSDKNNKALCLVKMRYKKPGEENSTLISQFYTLGEESALAKGVSKDIYESDFNTALTVAYFAQLLRESKFVDGLTYKELINFYSGNIKYDPNGYRGELLRLMKLADSYKNDYKYSKEKEVDVRPVKPPTPLLPRPIELK